MDRTGIGWLHLSDLQVGRDGATMEVPEVRGALEKDLRRIHEVSGPWAFVAISGNITATGGASEFSRATQALEWLWEWLHVLGSEPALVMVPGPLDLDPSTRQPSGFITTVSAQGSVTEPDDKARPPDSRLAQFGAFAADLEQRLRLTYAHAGVVPGDSSRIIVHGDLRIGLLGLSTPIPRYKLGYIAPSQLARACGVPNIATWVRGNDAVIVVGHHAGASLDAESARQLAEIDAPLLALCGPHPDGPGAPICSGRQVVLSGLPLARFEANRFGYRAGRMNMQDGQPVVRDWVRRLGAVAGTSSLGPLVASAVDADGSTSFAWRSDARGARAQAAMIVATRAAQIRHAAWSPTGDRVAAITSLGVLAMHDRHGERAQFPVHSSTPSGIAWDPTGQVVVTRSRFHSRIWSMDGMRRAEVNLACPSPMALAWVAPDRVLLGGDDGIHAWECRSDGSGRWLPSMSQGHLTPFLPLGKGVLALAVSPQLALAGFGTDDGLWLVSTDPITDPSTPGDRLHMEAAHALAWSPVSAIVAAGGASGVVRVWDARSRTRFARLEGLTDTVRSLSFSRDGQLLAATAIDGSYRVWSCDDWTPRLPKTMRGIDRLDVIAFSPTEDLVAFGGLNGLRIEQLLPDEEPAADDDPVVRTTSAKVVLLGEGNVGKSCLALRLTEDRYEELGSTHGMKFWSVPLERLDPEAVIPPGERREVVFWDMGGQNEYQLLHHAFLQDTMLALMVMEPRRGEAALRELEVWGRQLTPDRTRINRMLIGSKLDDDRVPRDPALVNRALAEYAFSGYVETSAKTGAGIAALRKAIARGIDWGSVAVTVRPQLFHRIRYHIDLRRTRALLPYHELEEIVKQREGTDVNLDVIGAVVEQLARQGLIADARLTDGSRMLILQVEQVERYAASLILAARDNPRGVPALEITSVGPSAMSFPRIAFADRLPREQELVVLECVIELLIKSGICFASGRLLIFPALFRSADVSSDPEAAHGAYAYAYAYDFVGSVDNIYSALVCWIAIDYHFGALRLSEHRAEWAAPGKGTCGIRRLKRSDHRSAGRFEIYFDGETDDATRQLFVGIVDDFLRTHDVELIEQLTVACPCGYTFYEEHIRYRLDRGASDIVCPRDDTHVPLVRAGSDAARAIPGFAARLRVFRTERLQTRQRAALAAKRALDDGPRDRPLDRNIHVVHLSDLHIPAGADITSLLQPLCGDLTDRTEGLGGYPPDLVMVSGDLTNRATPEEFAVARRFMEQLLDRCKLTAERCIVVPGNHDLSWDAQAYDFRPRRQVAVFDRDLHVPQGDVVLVRNDRYPERFRNFSEHFFHPLFQRPYSLLPEEQSQCILFDDLGIQVIALNSAWQIDEYFPERSSIHLGALTRTLALADAAVDSAKRGGRIGHATEVLRLAVWHHPLTGNEKIADDAFVESLRRAGIQLCLHGHVHEERADVLGYYHSRKLQVVGAGSFGAPGHDRPESVPRLYNLIELDIAGNLARVHTRQLRRAGGAWEPCYMWPGASAGERRPYYEFKLERPPA